MFHDRLRAGLAHVGQALRTPEDFALRWHHALREEELCLQRRGERLGEKRASHERPAHARDPVRSECSSEAVDERTNASRLDEQPFEIEPAVGVVPRFEAEVAVPRGRQAQEVYAPHDRSTRAVITFTCSVPETILSK